MMARSSTDEGTPEAATSSQPPAVYDYEQEDSGVRLTEPQALQAQKMETVGRLTASVAHDMNNLLMGIGGSLDMALGALGDHAARRYVVDAQNAIGAGAAMVRQLLSVSRSGSAEPTELVLDDVIARSEELMRQLLGTSIELRLELHAPTALVRSEAGRLTQILINVVANARDAMPDGGELRIRTGELHEGDERWVRLQVEDTGYGMDEATRTQAFAPFFTTKEAGHGTGLGLATVHSLVSQFMRGRVDLQSEPGRGTLLSFDFPQVGTAQQPGGTASEVEPPPEAGPTATRAERVLLVEDDPLVRRVARYYLEQGGYRVLAAEHPRQALEWLGQDPSIALLLTDLLLPGLPGPALAGQARTVRPGLPVVCMTAQPPQAMPQSTTEPFPVLPKPLSPRQLLDAVAGTLRSAGEQPRIRRGSEPGANVHPATILVVEDHPAARSALAEALSETGFRVLPASTVAAAGRIAIAERPQLLLSDVQLADGNGIALAEELRTADPALRVLYVTGRDVQAPDLRAALQAPRTAALGKPAALAEILFAVRGLLTAEGPDDPRPPERK